MGKYGEDLWDGFEIVYKRCADGKDFCKKLQGWYHKRASIEREYAKHLAALAKATEVDIGTVGVAWETVKAETLALSTKHQSIADSITAQGENPLGAFLKESKKPLAKLQEQGRKLLSELSKAESKEVGCKGAFEKAHKQQDETKDEYERATFNNAQSKQVDRLSKKLKGDTKKASQADAAYADSVSKLASTQQKVWHQEMPAVLSQLQDLEERRVDVVKTTFLALATIQETLAPAAQSVAEAIKTRAAAISSSEDVDTLIRENKTGATIPPTATYEPYDSAQGRCVPSSGGASAGGGASSFSSPSSSQDLSRDAGGSSSSFSPPSSSSSSMSAVGPPTSSFTPVMGGGPPTLVPRGGGGTGAEDKGISVARARYDYDSGDPSELSFKAGDIITVLEKDESGWWHGELNGASGVFPSVDWVEERQPDGSFVAVVGDGADEDEAADEDGGYGEAAVADEGGYGESAASGDLCYYVADFDFVGEAEDELSFYEGERFSAADNAEQDGWLWCTKEDGSGAYGKAPMNYVHAE
mmetsp:Transcript_11027/g.33761  ORF Transcript_11027/g.33761 Transcript_11027/m.33761 type:complete len:529 (-) Transcript_11027:49-1635(-)